MMFRCLFFILLNNHFSTAIPVGESFPKSEILIVMRTTKNNLNSRVQLALDTWSQKALAQVRLRLFFNVFFEFLGGPWLNYNCAS